MLKHIESDFRNLALLTVFVNLCAFGSVGYHYTVVNIPRPLIKDFINETMLYHYGYSQSHHSVSVLFSLVVACQGIGAIVGTAAGPYLLERIGRKWTALGVQPAFQVAGGIIIMLCWLPASCKMLIFGRLLIGVSTGLTFATVEVFLFECAPSRYRGLIGSVSSCCVLIGDSVARIVGVFATEESWFYMFGATAVLGFLQLLVAPCVCESPKFLLLTRKQTDRANEAIEFYFGKKRVLTRRRKIEREEEDNAKQAKLSLRRIAMHEVYRTPVFLAIAANAAVGASGMYAMFSYSTLIFESLNIHVIAQTVKTLTLIPVHLTAGIAQIFLVHRLKRRTLILGSLAIVIVCHLIFFVFATIDQYRPDIQPAAYIGSVALMVAILFMNVGVASVSLIIPSEISTIKARSYTATAGAFARMAGLLANQMCFYLMYREMGQYVFLILIFGSSLCFVYLARTLPETKRKSLDEITSSWRKHDNRVVPAVCPIDAFAAIQVERKASVQSLEGRSIFGRWD